MNEADPKSGRCPECGGDGVCPECMGSGEDDAEPGDPCFLCDGDGSCPECEGDGEVPEKQEEVR